MAEKPSINPRETYVIDEDELQDLEDSSLTGVMRDITNTFKLDGIPGEETESPSLDDDDFSSLNPRD